MILTWRKEWRINVNAEVCKEGREFSVSKSPRREMLDRDEHAEAMSQEIEKVYSLDLQSPPAWYMGILTSDLKTVFTMDIYGYRYKALGPHLRRQKAWNFRNWSDLGQRQRSIVLLSLPTWTVEGSYKFQWRCWQMHTWEVGCIFWQDCSF